MTADPVAISVELPCHVCGYDLRAHPREGTCPECGAAIAESWRVAGIRRRPAWRDSDPRGLVELMAILQSAAGGRGAPEFLSTHPNPGNRIGYLPETIEEKYATAAISGEKGEANFQRHVLSRRPTALLIDLQQPVTWCAVCRERQLNAAR